MRHGSESDRPDSGFDSNKEEREGSLTLRDDPESSSSPETVTEISRQGVARQPLKKKRNFTHHY